MEDELRQIPGYEGLYSVTRDGRVWMHSYGRWKVGRILYGYPRTSLCRAGRKVNFAIHRAVALAWIPNPDNLPQVNHKNGNKVDNRVENLEWVTRSENTKHAWAKGLLVSTEAHRAACARNARATHEGLRILTPDQRRSVAQAYQAGGLRLEDLAAEYGVSVSPIRAAIRDFPKAERPTNSKGKDT